MNTMMARIGGWIQHYTPTREQLQKSRLLRPVAHHILRSDLWRFNRRSVPRGVALGLFVGVMIPLAHFIVAAFLAVFIRANIPAAMLATFIGFPVFYVALVALAYKIGNFLLRVDAMTTIQPISNTMETIQTGHLLQYLTGAGLTTAFGLFVIATVAASLGYVITSLAWRVRVGRLRQARLQAVKARQSQQGTL
jgi:uncharacterized protein (DUF2062 family)